MSAVKRRLFNVLAAVSLVLCVVTVALWMRSYVATDAVIWNNQNQFAALETFTGVIEVSLSASTSAPIPDGWLYQSDPSHAAYEYLTLRRHLMDGSPGWFIAFPMWLALIVSALPLALWWSHRRRQKRRSATGCCPACGYDLRATPERCPECGLLVKPTA
jgi:hypothetical protein